MCFNAEVSLSTYILGMIGSYKLYTTGFKAESFLYFCVIQMQLIEYLLWTFYTNSLVNAVVSKIAIIINHFEPIAFWIGIKLYGSQLPMWLDYLMGVYLVNSILYTLHVWNKTDVTKVTEKTSPHLYWQWNDVNKSGFFYTFFLTILFLLSVYGIKGNGFIHGMIVLISFFISLMVYRDKHVVGAMWCFIAAFGPWLIHILYKQD